MHYLSKHAFTLVELIVVITILAILGTLGYISIIGYTQNAKNSVRLNDIKSISKVLELHLTTHGTLPTPDDSVHMSYSGGVTWKQGTFSSDAIKVTRKMSHAPLDPVYNLPYSYSILPSGRYYQLAGIKQKAALLGDNSPFIAKTHAVKSSGFSSYVTGNYNLYSSVIKSGSSCYILPTPSILISDIPTGGELIASLGYSFLENGGSNLPASYSGSQITQESSTSFFQIDEIWNSCSIDTIEDLNLFIARVSHAFQQMADNPDFENLIYNSNSLSTKKTIVDQLILGGLDINENIIRELNSPAPVQTFSDSFTNTDGTNLVTSHIFPWSAISGGSGAYNIHSNTLRKSTAGPAIISPQASPAISIGNYAVSFELIDFAGGSVEVFLRYIDANNYYKLRVNQGGYQLIRNLSGVQSVAQSISETISPGSTIQFGIQGNELSFKVNTIEKEKIVIPGIDSIGQAGISLENQNARIDNYVLSYK